MPPRARLISSSKAAGVLGIDSRTLVRWARAGRIKSYKTLGGHYRFDLGDVQQFRDTEMRMLGTDPDPTVPAQATPSR